MGDILLVLQFILAIVITLVVLLQKSANMGFSSYSGSNDGLFGARGPAGFLAKLTFFMGFLFVINTIALGYIYMQDSKKSITDNIQIPVSVPQNIDNNSSAVSVPQSPKILDTKEDSNTTK